MKAKLPSQAASYSVYAEKKRAAINKYRQENPEKFLESVKRSKAKNKARVKAYAKSYYELNKELVKEKRRERYKASREGQPKKIRECWKANGKRLPPDRYKNGSGFVMKSTQDDCVLPRGL